VLIVDVP